MNYLIYTFLKGTYSFFFLDWILLCSLGWPRAYYISYAGLELVIFLPQLP
jgi:hypothetical protein